VGGGNRGSSMGGGVGISTGGGYDNDEKIRIEFREGVVSVVDLLRRK